MNEIKLPFTQNVGKIILAVLIIVMLGGYGLFFNAKSRLTAQTNELNELKMKHADIESMLNTIKSRYDALQDNMKNLNNSLHDNTVKYQDCEQKLMSLEAKYEALRLNIKQTEPSATSGASPASTPAPESSSTAPAATATPSGASTADIPSATTSTPTLP